MSADVLRPIRKPRCEPSNGVHLRKRLGQYILVDKDVIEGIVGASGLNSVDEVLEIGAGLGALTEGLAKKAKVVIAVEIDEGFCRHLRARFSDSPNVRVVRGDFLKMDLAGLSSQNKKLKVVGNLPYYITTPIIMHLLKNRSFFSQMVVMVQREVAERIAASPGGKDYGVLSVVVQYYADVEKKFLVSKKSFLPSPEVDSTVLSLKPYETSPVEVRDERLFFSVVKAAFSTRRKKLFNDIFVASLLDLKME